MHLNTCSLIEHVILGIYRKSYLFVTCTLQDLFNEALSMRVYAPSTLFSVFDVRDI